MPDPVDLDALDRLIAAATPGPWNTGPMTGAGHVWVYSNCDPLCEPASARDWLKKPWRLFSMRRRFDLRYDGKAGCLGDPRWGIQEANAALIVALRNAAPALLAELRAARADVVRLRDERRALMSVTTTEGFSASEWMLRTGLAKTQLEEARAELARRDASRMFPLQTDKGPLGPLEIPWAIAEEAYAAYVRCYGGEQTLERLAERGGFGWLEMDELLPGWRERVDVLARRDAELREARELLDGVREEFVGDSTPMADRIDAFLERRP